MRDRAPDLVIALSCSFCRGVLVRDDVVYCASCLAPHHPECFRDHGRCSVMGCSETRVVRPSELTPLERERATRRAARPPSVRPPSVRPSKQRPRRRRRWRTAGLGVALAGAAAAAAYVDAAAPWKDEPSVTPQWQVRQAVPRRHALVSLEVYDATLSELLEALRRAVPEARVEVSPHLRDVLVRRAKWEDEPWPAGLDRLCRALGLRLEEGALGWSIEQEPLGLLPHDLAASAVVPVQVTQRVPVEQPWDSRALVEGWGYRLWSAAGGDAAAVSLEPTRLELYGVGRSRHAVQAPGPIQDVVWAPAGHRVAYLAAASLGAELGVVSLMTGETRTRQLDARPDRARLRWLADGETLAVWDDEALQLVNLATGEAVTLASPTPRDAGRFELHPLEGDRVLLARGASVELWTLRPSPRRLGEPVPVPPGYRLQVAPQRSVALVETDTEAHALRVKEDRLEAAGVPVSRQATELDEPWRVELSPSGQLIAYLKGGELFVRRAEELEGRLELVRTREREAISGFAWSPRGDQLALWSSRACFLLSADSLEFAHGLGTQRAAALHDANGGSIEEVRWSGERVLLIDVATEREREPRVHLERSR